MKLSQYAAMGFPSHEVRTATAVAMAESGGDPEIDNGICCIGLWQVNLIHAGIVGSPKDKEKFRQWLKDPKNNAKAAGHIFRTQAPANQWSMAKWEAWGNGRYRTFLASKADPEIKGGKSWWDKATDNPLDDIKDAADSLNPVTPVTNAADAVGSALKEITGFVARLFDPYIWLRAGKGILGAVLLMMGAAFLAYVAISAFMQTGAAKAVKKASPVRKLAPTGA